MHSSPACREPGMFNPVFPPQSLVHLRVQDPCNVTLVTLPQRDFSHVAFRACQDASLPECTIPLTRTPPGVPKYCFPWGPEGLRLCRRRAFRDPAGHLFRLHLVTVRLHSHGAISERKLCIKSGARHTPRCPKGTTKESKSSLFGASRVTFACRREKICPMRKHQYLLWFKHILRVRAPPFSHSKSTRERTVHQKLSFSAFYTHFWHQSDAQGRPKAGPRDPKGSTRSSKAIPGTPKSLQKIDLRPHLGTQGRPGGSRGTPGKENDTKID